LKKEFDYPVGISDHTKGITVCLAAVALGAKVVEKHFTYDKTAPSRFGENHDMSIDAGDLKEIVKHSKTISKALGSETKEPTESEKATLNLIRRSIIATADIPTGSKITEDMVDILRPATGIEPEKIDEVIGKVAKKDIKRFEPVTWGKI